MERRCTEISRETAETKIFISLELDGTGAGEIDTGCGFLDHMLTLFQRHGRFDLTVRCEGDTQVDDHHTVEDIGIVLGSAFAACLGERRGIRRYAHRILPMDEALILCAADVSGRAHLEYALDIPTEKVGTFDTELVKEFWLGFVRTAGITLHFRQFSGENSHHIIEGAFKAAARVLDEACSVDARYADEIPSTKGVL